MGDPLFWLLLLRVLQTGIRTLGDLFMGAVDTTSKIIGLGNGIADFRAKIGELGGKAHQDRMGMLIQLQVAALEAHRIQAARLESAYGEYTAAFQVSTEAETRISAEMQELNKLLKQRNIEDGGLIDAEHELERELLNHLKISSRLASHLDETVRRLDDLRTQSDQQANQLEALNLQVDALKKVLGI